MIAIFNSYETINAAISDYYNLPSLKMGKDQKKLLRSIEFWVMFTKAQAEARIKLSKAKKTTMGYILYQSSHKDYEKVIDNAVESKILVMDYENEDKEVNIFVQFVDEHKPF